MVRNDGLVEEVEAVDVHQHARVTFCQQCHIERASTGAGMAKAHLVAQDGPADPRRPLNDGNATWDETAGKDRVEAFDAAGYSVCQDVLMLNYSGQLSLVVRYRGSRTLKVEP